MVEWEIRGMQFTNCSCAYGCPCQFNALPTHGDCRALIFVRIDQGHFGEVRLEGLNMALAIAWPGAVHQGRGTMQPILDERGSESQKAGLLSIMTGKETDPMTTFLSIYTAMCATIREPLDARISIDLDMAARRASCQAQGIAKTRGEPVLNPVTKKELRAGIVLPNGSEYGQCEVGRGWSECTSGLELMLENSHAHWCEIHLNRHGRIH